MKKGLLSFINFYVWGRTEEADFDGTRPNGENN